MSGKFDSLNIQDDDEEVDVFIDESDNWATLARIEGIDTDENGGIGVSKKFIKPPVQDLFKFDCDIIENENSRFIQKVFGWMGFGLLLTALFSGLSYLYVANLVVPIHPHLYYLLGGLELGIVFYISYYIEEMRAIQVKVWYLCCCSLSGIVLTPIFLYYEIDSITGVFGLATIFFLFSAILGFFSKDSISELHNFLIMGVVILILGGVFNLIFFDDLFGRYSTYGGIFIFLLYTAYDIQYIKKMNIIGNEGSEEDDKEAIIGALALYLDFINLFLNLLKLKITQQGIVPFSKQRCSIIQFGP